MLPILKKISPFNHYNGGNNVQYIVIHDVGALGQVRANLNYFYTQSRGASAHLFVDDTEIGQSVEFYNPAFHVGDDKKNDQHDVGDLIHNRNSIGVEMCLDKNYKVTEKTKANTVELVHYLLKLYPNAKVVRHHDASGKICPRSMSGNNWSEWKVFYQRLVGNVAVSKPTTVNKPSTVTVTKNDTLWGISKQYDTDVRTLKAINGLSSDTIHVGDVLSLASTGVKASVIKPVIVVKAAVSKTIDQLAQETINGVHGSGEARKKALGANFNAVQNRVNELLKVKAVVKSPVKTIQQLVNEVMTGKHGNGDARKKSLGGNYNAVMNAINGKSVVSKKSITEIAKEVIAGKFGNGNSRKTNIEKAGYNYNEVQKAVNKLI